MSAYEWGVFALGFFGGGVVFTGIWWTCLRVTAKRDRVRWNKKNITVEKGQDDV